MVDIGVPVSLDVLSQAWVTMFGLSALLCMQMNHPHARRSGVVLGLLGQPAWYMQLVIHEQWGMLPVFVGYTLVWLFGAWNHFGRSRGAGKTPSAPPSADHLPRPAQADLRHDGGECGNTGASS